MKLLKNIYISYILILLFTSCTENKMYPIKLENEVYFIDYEGNKVTPNIFGSTEYGSYEVPTIFINRYSYCYFNTNGKKMFDNFDVKDITENNLFSDGLLRKYDKITGLVGYVNIHDEWVIPPIYERGNKFSSGYAWVTKRNDSFKTLINKRGKEILHAKDFSGVSNFKNGYAYVQKKIVSDYYVPLIENGQKVSGAKEFVSGSFGGIINCKGKEIIPFVLGEYTMFSDNLFKYREKYLTEEGVKYSLIGYKSSNNKWVIKPRYKNASDFKYGLAVISENLETKCLINKKGEIILDKNYKYIQILSNKYLIVSYDEEIFYLVDLKGNVKSKPFKFLYPLDENMFLVSIDNTSYYINKKGKIIQAQYFEKK